MYDNGKAFYIKFDSPVHTLDEKTHTIKLAASYIFLYKDGDKLMSSIKITKV